MSQPHFEVASGSIDGSNETFSVSLPYTSGTLAVFLNGQLKVGGDTDGWVETSPKMGVFSMNTPPELGDVLQAFYIDTLPVQPGFELTPIFGSIEACEEITGELEEPTRIVGVIMEFTG